MIYAVISDIHANLDALDAVLKDAAACGAQRIVCLGDIVGYGPLPVETLRRLRDAAAIVLAGNHDDAVSGRIKAENFIDLASEAVSRHRAALSADDLAYLRALPHVAAEAGAAFSHGDFSDPKAFKYITSGPEAAASFAARSEQLLFVGHTHVPSLFLIGHSGEVHHVEPLDFALEDGKRYLVNVGSVGYPRAANGLCESSYVLYDDTAKTVLFRRVPFNVASVMERGIGPMSPRRPKRTRLGCLGLMLLLTALVVGVLAPYFRTAPAPVLVEATPENPVFAEQRLYFTSAKHNVRSNVRLLRSSAPAILVISFEDDHQRELSAITNLVVRYTTRKIKIPTGAVSARFSLRTSVPGERPQIDGFAPCAE